MGSITGGSVSFTRTIRPADFESKSATVTLSFALDEGEDAGFIDEVSSMAKEKALAAVGVKAAPVATTTKPAKEPKAEASQETKDALKAAAAKSISDKEAAKAAKKSAKDKKTETLEEPPLNISTGEERNDPDNLDDEGDAGGDPDGLDDLAEQTEAKEITDKELTDAVTQCAATTKNSVAIRKLREKFVALPKGFRDIPQQQRAEFIAGLKDIPKVG